MWKHIFSDFRIPASFGQLFEFVTTNSHWLLLAIFGTLMMLVISIIQRKCQVRDLLAKLPSGVRVVVLTGLTIFVVVFGGMAMFHFGGGGFMYAGF